MSISFLFENAPAAAVATGCVICGSAVVVRVARAVAAAVAAAEAVERQPAVGRREAAAVGVVLAALIGLGLHLRHEHGQQPVAHPVDGLGHVCSPPIDGSMAV